MTAVGEQAAQDIETILVDTMRSRGKVDRLLHRFEMTFTRDQIAPNTAGKATATTGNFHPSK
jgi:hypothetical protein